jgi:hypothetical protein
MRIIDFARPVLEESAVPLTPEVILERAKARFGEEAIVVSARGAGNTLTPQHNFFLLGPRSYGLRQHFKGQPRFWRQFRIEFAKLLEKENRPVSTTEVVERERICGLDDMNAYELAQIIREDKRFIDLGRHLFALAEWGIQERERVKDLVPRVFEKAGHALTAQQTLDRLTRLRSVSPYSIANILQKHPKIRSYGFSYYGLNAWRVPERRVMLMDRSVIESAVRRRTPPVSFGLLCDSFGIGQESEDAVILWKTCAASPKLRRAPEKQTPQTLLLHKSLSLEAALASILRELQRPAPAYELEWELSAKFGTIFAHVSLSSIEERLTRSARFLRNAAGEFLLDAELDLEQYDVEALRDAVHSSLAQSADVVACSDLIERLGQQGFDVTELSADMLAAILRGSKDLQEVGHQRFRARNK